jgi:peptidoglycan/xylan/chitin deacetylase (PgdA/CDA1 family)
MRFLHRRYRPLTLEEAVRRLRAGEDFAPDEALLTFDDGYRDNFTYAFPVLRGLGLPATIFVTTGYVGSERYFWWDELARALPGIDAAAFFNGVTSDAGIGAGLRGAVGGLRSTRRAIHAVVAAARDASPPERERFMEAVRRAGGPTASSGRVFLSWEEIRTMAEHGIEFGSHTRTHPFLTQIPPEAAREEIASSRRDLEERLGKPVVAFAYPDGRFDDAIERLVEEAGYACAFQTRRLARAGRGSRYALPRRPVKEAHSSGFGGRFSPRLFAAELDGAVDRALLREPRR